MLFDPSTAPHLKPWLVRTLEPICDAEPGALTEYVLALLKHNVPENEMRKELSAQLEEFLEKEVPSFIDTLFTVLRTKSYLPYTANSPPHSYSPSSSNTQSGEVGIPIPLDSFLSSNSSSDRGQKRSLDHDDRDGPGPAKGPRLSADSQFSRYSNGRDNRLGGQWGGRFDRGDRQSMNGANGMGQGMDGLNGRRIQTYQPPEQRRGICRDYHNNGYCARGALCKYSHGDDAFVPSQLFPMAGTAAQVPFLPMFANGSLPFAMAGPTAAYDPHEARMDMRPNNHMLAINGRGPQRPPLLPREDGSHPTRASGELPVIQDLTPQVTEEATPSTSSHDNQSVQNGHQISASYQPQSANLDVDMNPPGPPTQDTRSSGAGRGGFRGRGTFTGDAQTFRPERRNDKTLVVEKIPEDKLSLDAVNGWFKRFGTVTNVAIDAQSGKALVSFSEHREAHAAWKSEDAVFGNRFVKVFWHRPMEGHGQKGTRMLAASAPLVANIAARGAGPSAGVTSEALAPAAAATPRKHPAPSSAASELAAKQKLLEQQITEQKTLMASLTSASGEEKKNIMARLRKLGEEMQPPPSTASTTSASAHPPAPAPSTPLHVDEHAKKERERLDKELELHAASGGESTEELQVKLAKLKAEAASLGISDHQGGSGSLYRPYRGRGRGGRSAFFRGAMRGGPTRASMKLDNRPRKLVVKGVREDAIQAIRDWYETTGQLDSAESHGDEVVVSFRTRAGAEQGLAKGSDIPSVGSVQISWHTVPQLSAGPQAPSGPSLHSEAKDNRTDEMRGSSPPPQGHQSPRRQEEEVVASGWGDGEEDDMGF